MRKIKFSHNYFKMPVVEGRTTFLIGITKLHYKEIPKSFIFFDTLFCDNLGKLHNYLLPKTDLIILTLFTESEQSPKVWTTIRRYTIEKYKYYSELIGQEIKVVISEIE